MNYLSIEQITEKITRNGYKCAWIYDRVINTLRPDLPNFERYEANDAHELAKSIELFSKTYTGTFTIVLRKVSGGNASATSLVYVNFMSAQVSTTGAVDAVPVNGQFETPQQMEERICNKIRAEMLHSQLQIQNQNLQNKLDGLESSGGKLAFMIENFVMAKLNKVPPINGTGNNSNMNGIPEVNEENLVQAYKKLTEVLTPEILIKLANKLKPGDPVLDIVKNYANT